MGTTVPLTWWRKGTDRLRQRAGAAIRRSAGLSGTPPPRCDDPARAYAAVDGVARVVHGDLASMFIGGLGSLFLQMLHPHAMAGVADHSRYQEDPRGRLLSTANFISTTTYGSRERAREAIERVLYVHRFVHGVADDGQPYDANDPHLLSWVHCAEVSMFLEGYRRFGRRSLSAGDADRYVREMAKPARDLGVLDPPQSVAQLRAQLAAFRPELRLSADGATARDFVARGHMRSSTSRMVYRLLVRCSWTLLEPWARDLLGVPRSRFSEHLCWRPAGRALSRLLRLAVPPVPAQVARVSPPSTTTT